MLGLNFGISGANEFQSGMSRIANALPGGIYAATVQSCALVETRAKTHHLAGGTLNYRTHRLQQSVKSDVRTNGYKVTGRVGSPVVYAAINEFGGIIKPVKAKHLSFQIDGRWIRASQVTIPARPWLFNSLDDELPQIEAIYGRQLEIVIG